VFYRPGLLTPREISPVKIAQEAGSPGASLEVLENRYSFASAGTRNPDLPARSLVTIMTELFWLLVYQKTKKISLHLERRARSQLSSQIIKFESMLKQPKLIVANCLYRSVTVK
jgi:hypothetical protein